jgi:2-polyprenyl-6-methoxyphenol hydroxylase-like FAD-dependent oxidoreductase
MADIEITRADIQKILQQKIQQITNMELQNAALVRTVSRQSEELEALKIAEEQKELNGN